MWRNIMLAAGILAVSAMGIAAFAQQESEGARAGAVTLRVGVYDSRAIAIAYGNSAYNPAGEKRKQHEAAKKAGDTKRMKELEAWGPKHQRQLHRQGFGRVPVTDLLAHVEHHLPDVAAATGVDVIAFECNYAGPDVETVDITMELVMLFEPEEKVLKWVEQLKDHEPLDLDEIEKHHDDH